MLVLALVKPLVFVSDLTMVYPGSSLFLNCRINKSLTPKSESKEGKLFIVAYPKLTLKDILWNVLLVALTWLMLKTNGSECHVIIYFGLC